MHNDLIENEITDTMEEIANNNLIKIEILKIHNKLKNERCQTEDEIQKKINLLNEKLMLETKKLEKEVG